MNNFDLIYSIQNRIKINKSLSNYVESSIEPNIKEYDEDLSKFIYNIFLSMNSIWLITNIKDSNDFFDKMNELNSISFKIIESEVVNKIKKTIPQIRTELLNLAENNEEFSFKTIPFLFNYFWCIESTNEFVNLLLNANPSAFFNMINSLVYHPLITSYFKASIQPIFNSFSQLNEKELVELTKNSLKHYSGLIPDFFKDILTRVNDNNLIFWNSFLSKFINNPYIFDFVKCDFEIFHQKKFISYFFNLESFFLLNESSNFIKDICNSNYCAVAYPSSELFEIVTNKSSDQLLISNFSKEFLNSIINFNIENNDLILFKPIKINDNLNPYELNLNFIEKVIKILNECLLIYPENITETSYDVLNQITQLTYLNGGPNFENYLLEIKNYLNNIKIPDLCHEIEEILCHNELSGHSKIMKTIAKYSKQNALIKIYSNSSNLIFKNTLIFSKFLLIKPIVLQLCEESNLLNQNIEITEITLFCSNMIKNITENYFFIEHEESKYIISLILNLINFKKFLNLLNFKNIY